MLWSSPFSRCSFVGEGNSAEMRCPWNGRRHRGPRSLAGTRHNGSTVASEASKRCLFKLFSRRLLVEHEVNRVLDVFPIDGVFCLIFDCRIYNFLGQAVDVVYDLELNTCLQVSRPSSCTPKDYLSFNLGNGASLISCPSLGLSLRARRLPKKTIRF